MTVEAVTDKQHHTPLRMCVGCRGRQEQNELLRIVGVGPDASQHNVVTLSPDPRRQAGGRGAYVHCDFGCVRSAIRRRAFGRALRLDGRVEAEQLIQWVEQHQA